MPIFQKFKIFVIIECKCHMDGSQGDGCGEKNGDCTCKENVVRLKCNQCATGYYGFPNCKRNTFYSIFFYFVFWNICVNVKFAILEH